MFLLISFVEFGDDHSNDSLLVKQIIVAKKCQFIEHVWFHNAPSQSVWLKIAAHNFSGKKY